MFIMFWVKSYGFLVSFGSFFTHKMWTQAAVPTRLAILTLKEILELQNDSDIGVEYTVENSDPSWELDVSDEEDSEVI